MATPYFRASLVTSVICVVLLFAGNRPAEAVEVVQPPGKNSGRVLAAVRGGDLELLSTLLATGSDPNEVDSIGETPLHAAARQSDGRFAIALIKAGADVNVRTRDGITPLHLALGLEHRVPSEILIAAGADPSAQSVNGVTPRDLQFARLRALAAEKRIACNENSDSWHPACGRHDEKGTMKHFSYRHDEDGWRREDPDANRH